MKIFLRVLGRTRLGAGDLRISLGGNPLCEVFIVNPLPRFSIRCCWGLHLSFKRITRILFFDDKMKCSEKAQGLDLGEL